MFDMLQCRCTVKVKGHAPTFDCFLIIGFVSSVVENFLSLLLLQAGGGVLHRGAGAPSIDLLRASLVVDLEF